MPVVTTSAAVLPWRHAKQERVIGVDDPVAFWLFMPLPFLVTIVVALVSARRFELPAGKWIETSLTALVQARRRLRSKI